MRVRDSQLPLQHYGVLSIIALGISAISGREKSTPALWYIWWILGGAVAQIAERTQPWLRHISFNYNLEQIGLAIFRLGNDVGTARDNVPILGEMLRNIPPQTMTALSAPALGGAAATSVMMIGLAVFIIHKRVKPE